jgi:hypothetical protein
MTDHVLPILIAITVLALFAFAIAICKAGARADAIESHRRPERQGSGERAVPAAISVAPSSAWAQAHRAAAAERPVAMAPVFLVDEHGATEKLIEVKTTASPSVAQW